uniref:Pseudouridine synthase RsuA/RluA-like domain-containing protein n=1 Tax=Alexandrium monilatum TaxID=311494 RepID=A0A7S4QG04_9DINO
MAWAIAVLLVEDEPLISALAAEAIPKITEFACQELANLAWAVASLRIGDVPLFASISAASIPRIKDYNFQDIVNTAWSFAELRVPNAPLFASISSAAIRRLAAAPLAGAGVPKSEDVLGTLHALASIAVPCAPLRAATAAHLGRRAAALDARETARAAPPPSGGRNGGGRPEILLAHGGLCILWKPAGWTVSVASGGSSSAEEEWQQDSSGGLPLQRWLIEEFGADHPIALDADISHGLLHRLDRQTSGALAWAWSYTGYFASRVEFASLRVLKEYVCLCGGWLPRSPCLLEVPLREVRLGPSKLRSVVHPLGRRACTEVLDIKHLVCQASGQFSLVAVRLHTGRLHQIRVHLSDLGYALLGDAAYGGATPPWCPRILLHARRLALGTGDGPIDVPAPWPQDLREVLALLAAAGGRSRESAG